MINFDFPADTDSYIHRVGRTARGNNKGSALSLIAARELERAQKVEKGRRIMLEILINFMRFKICD